MKKIMATLCFLAHFTAFSQVFELSGGYNVNRYFDSEETLKYASSNYVSDNGYALQFGIDEVKIDWLILRFTLGFEKYSGFINVSNYGAGGSISNEAQVDKSIISLGMYPVKFKIAKTLDVDLGMEYSWLISDHIDGRSKGSITGKPSWDEDLNERYSDFSEKTYVGFRGRVKYDIKMTDKLTISPQFTYYHGVTSEFIEFINTRSMRFGFGLRIQRKIE
ncbi:MAG: hypothetical protein ACPGSD_14765 [Flavobacteriales bacterium]